MGMAASQARLLSITSRMSDNELRSQLINNAKMRLTEDSAKASERYVSALNQTQLMMSNKDTMGNNLYQQLNFNNLTAYSSYNNQYGLINKSGAMVVSELEAAKYEQALKAAETNPETDALTEFLKSYGIEKDSTSFWESNQLSEDLKIRYEGDMAYDDAGNRISGLHYGYELSKTSTEVSVYEQLLGDYTKADNEYTSAVTKAIKEYVLDYIPNGESMEYEDKYAEVLSYNTGEPVQTPTTNESLNSLNYLNKLFTELVADGYIKTTVEEDGVQVPSPFCQAMEYYLNEMIVSDGAGGASIAYAAAIEEASGGGYTISSGEELFKISGTAPNYTVALTSTANNDPDFQYGGLTGITKNADGTYSFKFNSTEYEEDDDGNRTSTTSQQTCTFSTSPLEAYITRPADAEATADAVKEVYKYFQRGILDVMDRDKFGHLAPTEKSAFEQASKELSIFIFGTDIGSENYENLDDMDWIINSGMPTTNLDGNTTIIIEQNIGGEFVNMEYQANFEAIKDIYLIEEMISIYGAPKYTWVDKNNPNENAEAKAQWYTNIFEKMQESGYQKISLELTKSADWIQFAFESGLLTMVQVSDENKWVPTMYSNCSDITEDTIDLEVTRAEAEYKRETQKIQAKDKRYDLELKNIDTEHNSLQAEYDSIKSVIDKNIERNLKYFS